jgi:hypothetical protein
MEWLVLLRYFIRFAEGGNGWNGAMTYFAEGDQVL